MSRERATPPLTIKETRLRDIGAAIFVEIILEDSKGKLWQAPNAAAFHFDLKPYAPAMSVTAGQESMLRDLARGRKLWHIRSVGKGKELYYWDDFRNRVNARTGQTLKLRGLIEYTPSEFRGTRVPVTLTDAGRAAIPEQP